MTLPPRKAKAKPERDRKRESRWRSTAHRDFVRSFDCAVPGCKGVPTQVAHYRLGSGAGMGQKPDDWRSTPLCQFHHDQQHVIGEPAFWRAYEAAAGQSVHDLIHALCEASPRAREIREVVRNG